MDYVILVDSEDREVGKMEKLEAHQKGVLHRAFSIFLFNSEGKMLIQKRAASKYHSPDLWTNACCSHPSPGESILQAANRRLKEEMGLTTKLVQSFSFQYKEQFENNLIEHELDHVLVGYIDSNPELNPEEAQDYRWIIMSDLITEIKSNPDQFTVWFKIILDQHIEKLEKEMCHASL